MNDICTIYRAFLDLKLDTSFEVIGHPTFELEKAGILEMEGNIISFRDFQISIEIS